MNWKTIFKSFKSRDMQKRLLIVLALVVIYRFLAHVPVPLAEPAQLKTVLENLVQANNLGGFFNLLSGGALASLSIVLVGLTPYITASVIMQLLTKAIPRLEELHKDGETQRRKINQWTRLITLPLAILQSVAFIFILRQTVLAGNAAVLGSTTPFDWFLAILAMTTGAMLLMWLGELITEQGVGNGISLLIFAGIVSQLPSTFGLVGASLTNLPSEAAKLHVFNWFVLPVNAVAFYVFLAIGVVALVALYAIVKINEAQRVVQVNYAKRVRGNREYGGVSSILPIKLITAGVIPVIFAVAFLALPAFAGQLLLASKNPAWTGLADNLVRWFQTPNPGSFTGSDPSALIYPAAYFALVVLFTYFYTSIVFNSAEIAENLSKQNAFIANVRPGEQTEKHLSTIVNRLTLFGSLALGLIAVLPFVSEFVFAKLGINAQNLAIGGTGLLIVVSVALESLRHINSRALMVTYDEY
ncbi:MAG: preprotein translocase subunit SecY [Candidatus Chaera renei]|uniref:Protein translocase subunit SecY n=1 Tax=Candidatus Chaera renei TaxID=2506947 RepID=A0A4V1J7N2_9BACT|nr:MAG: preprotein translocase subunit SecY [Candidatus Chaera renei]